MRKVQIALPKTGEDEWKAVRDPIVSGWLTQGPRVAEFEKAFGEIHRSPHCIATTSCTTALHLILAALDISEGDEVIVPAFTWVATANVVLYCGAKPVFVDVDPRTFNLDPTQLTEKITERTKAIIAVHLFGLCADMDAIKKASGNIPIIEDAACAIGASYKGKPAGTLGKAGAFSFHPRKIVTTGEGGMVTTQDTTLAEKISCLRNHGASISEEQRHAGPRPYLLAEFNLLGFNYRMTDLQGALGLVQLAKLKEFQQERSQWAKFYEQELATVKWLQCPKAPEDCTHGWQSYVCMVDPSQAPAPRNEIMERLQASGVSTRPGTHSVPSLGYYQQHFGTRSEDFPGAHECAEQSIAIPLHNQMTKEDYEYVVAQIKGIA